MSDKKWGGARKGAGAPVTVGAKNRRKQRAISLSDEEYEKFKSLAADLGVSTSELIRQTFEL